MNIVLTGFMGVGKTTIGRKLSLRLGYFFIDTDEYIENEQGCSIRDIFQYAGESCFRDLETCLLKKLQHIQNTVLSTGGGIILRAENRKLLRELGKVVYLQISAEILSKRLRQDQSRPLLKTEEYPQQKIHSMLLERSPLYEQADVAVQTINGHPNQIVTRIIEVL